MRLTIILGAIVPLALGCTNPKTDPCASNVVNSGLAFCATYTTTVNTATTGLPAWASACSDKPSKISSVCSCFATATVPPTTLQTSTKTSTSSPVTAPTGPVSTANPPTATGGAGGGTPCTVTAYASISSAVASCSSIILSGISAPASSSIDLSKLKTGARVAFAGKTTFGTTKSDSFNPIVISGTDVTITGESGHVIDGNGQAYWDGQGSNGGTDKPDHFIVAKDLTNAVISNLYIQNYPVHCFDITGGDTILLTGITLDNSAGNAANSASGGLPAAHNSDGFDISSTNNLILENTSVNNQDDCVAVTSGQNILVTGMNCTGGHGLSIGSIGGKSDNTVDLVTFSNSVVTNSQNGCRIKTNSGTTGSVSNVVYNNISLSGISNYGIDVQQDYLNGGPTGDPTNGVTIDGLAFDVQGSVESGADAYYILCGSGSCSNFNFGSTSISGGSTSCNYPPSGCP
ncbi:glycoside hydrolase family 28 protein [Oidiodendron maius Zn]|uniref:endo-polygalacturonase n=1 Tax=Oidiodendron maius (strain Zn) TaxID=913774 RepID=A0A0C3HIY6_OIDMZ|nr:glycoside hydrolase family 28 protein [Oidiodendron maius Zn]